MSAEIIIPDAACIAVCALAAILDVRRFRIPNWLTMSAATLGIFANLALAGPRLGLLPSLAGGAALLAAAGVLGALRVWGMGDVKLLAAAGFLVRWPLAPRLLLDTALAGGVLALLWLLAGAGRKGRIPYALAILAGASLAVLSRYVPLLQIP